MALVPNPVTGLLDVAEQVTVDGMAGTGTTGTIAKFTDTEQVGDSSITDDGSTVEVDADLNVLGDILQNGVPISTGSVVQTISRDFTAVELNALFVTPIEVIPAPGPGFVIVPTSVIFRSTFGTVAYNSGTLTLLYTDASGETTGASQGFPADPGDTLVSVFPTLNGSNITDVEDQAIVAVNDDTDPSTGDGTMSVTILYTVVAV